LYAAYFVNEIVNEPACDAPPSERTWTYAGSELGAFGLDVKLPDDWLVEDSLPDPRYQDQLTHDSDFILLRRVSE
jgi:hypothetical protein